MMIEIDSEVIAEIRNALQIIMGNAELIRPIALPATSIRANTIIKQVKRIGGLLPSVKFEG